MQCQSLLVTVVSRARLSPGEGLTRPARLSLGGHCQRTVWKALYTRRHYSENELYSNFGKRKCFTVHASGLVRRKAVRRSVYYGVPNVYVACILH